jgi:hypothetical protein
MMMTLMIVAGLSLLSAVMVAVLNGVDRLSLTGKVGLLLQGSAAFTCWLSIMATLAVTTYAACVRMPLALWPVPIAVVGMLVVLVTWVLACRNVQLID